MGEAALGKAEYAAAKHSQLLGLPKLLGLPPPSKHPALHAGCSKQGGGALAREQGQREPAQQTIWLTCAQQHEHEGGLGGGGLVGGPQLHARRPQPELDAPAGQAGRRPVWVDGWVGGHWVRTGWALGGKSMATG